MKFQTPYDRSARPTIETPEKGAKQSFQKECDINNIMAKYQKTGVLQHIARNEGRYGFADATTFQDAMFLVTEARNQFEDLPSKLRNHFGNVESWLEFAVEHGDGTPEALQELLEEPREPSEEKTGGQPEKPPQAAGEAPAAPQEPAA